MERLVKNLWSISFCFKWRIPFVRFLCWFWKNFFKLLWGEDSNLSLNFDYSKQSSLLRTYRIFYFFWNDFSIFILVLKLILNWLENKAYFIFLNWISSSYSTYPNLTRWCNMFWLVFFSIWILIALSSIWFFMCS